MHVKAERVRRDQLAKAAAAAAANEGPQSRKNLDSV